MKQSEVFALLKKFVGQSNILTAPVAFVRYTGSLDCAVFLSQIIYWTDRSEDGWFYKSYPEWEIEICLSEYEIRKNCRLLKNKGILVTKLKKVNGAPVVHYRLNEGIFSESILKFLQNPICKDSESNLELVKNAIRTNLTNLDTEKTSESINKDYQRLPSEITSIDPVETPDRYVRRTLKESGVSFHEAAERARTRGHRLSVSYLSSLANGMKSNPSVLTVQALAAGLGRPETEIFEVFRILIPPFHGKEFLDALDAYDRTAQQRKVKESPEQRRLLFKKLASWGEAASVRALEETVSNGWRGVFEPKGINNGANQPRQNQTAAERRNASVIRNRERAAELRSLGDGPVESILRREPSASG